MSQVELTVKAENHSTAVEIRRCARLFGAEQPVIGTNYINAAQKSLNGRKEAEREGGREWAEERKLWQQQKTTRTQNTRQLHVRCGEPHAGLRCLLESLLAADTAGQGTPETKTGETLHASFLQDGYQFLPEAGADTPRSQSENSSSEANKPDRISENPTARGRRGENAGPTMVWRSR